MIPIRLIIPPHPTVSSWPAIQMHLGHYFIKNLESFLDGAFSTQTDILYRLRRSRRSSQNFKGVFSTLCRLQKHLCLYVYLVTDWIIRVHVTLISVVINNLFESLFSAFFEIGGSNFEARLEAGSVSTMNTFSNYLKNILRDRWIQSKLKNDPLRSV